MENKRLIKFTLPNIVLLLVFTTILISCQKKLYPSAGHFTQSLQRLPASDGMNRFDKFQDSKQIFIFCKLNSADPKECYKSEFKKSIDRFQEKFAKIPALDQEQLFLRHAFVSVEKRLHSNLEQTLMEIEPEINKLSNQRISFCKENSNKARARCLNQNIEKDAFIILNKYHHKVKLNGQEYLYTKNIIQENLNEKLLNLQKSVI